MTIATVLMGVMNLEQMLVIMDGKVPILCLHKRKPFQNVPIKHLLLRISEFTGIIMGQCKQNLKTSVMTNMARNQYAF